MHPETGQHPTTVLTWLLTVLIVGPILTHRRFPLASVAVCLAAVAVYATGRYVAYPGLAVFVLTFDIALHSRERMALAALPQPGHRQDACGPAADQAPGA